MKFALPLVVATLASPALAEGTRELDSHEHGVGELNIAIEGQTVAMAFAAPGADIVGFEYEAESEKDRAAVETALMVLSKPLDLFVMPAAAGCSVVKAGAELESEDDHDDHDHDEHEDHDDHDDHDHDEHDDHEHDEHDDHDDHDDHDHGDAEGHTEFHAEYTLSCEDPSAIDEISFAYFDSFENAAEVEVQIVSATGAAAFEVERDAPTLNVQGLF